MILLLAGDWTSLVVFWRLVASKRSSTPCTKRQREGPDCGEKENLPTMLCMTTTGHGGEILLLIPGWTLWLSLDASCGDSLTCHYAPNDDKMSSLGRVRESPHYALIVTESSVGRFSYSPEAGHLLSSFGAWWRVRESPHHAPNDNERVQTVVRKRISPSCSE